MRAFKIFSNRYKKFFDNPRAIFPFLRKYFYYSLIADRYIKFYNKDQFLDYTETLDMAINENKTLIRFGDELFDMLNGIGLYFNDWRQKFSPKLANSIKELLHTNNPDILICFNPELILKSKSEFKKEGIGLQWQFWINSKIFLKDFILKDKIYGSALCFNPNYNKNIDYKKLKEFFLKKNIIIVASNINRFEKIKLGKTTDLLTAPKSDAFEKYDEIKSSLIHLIETKEFHKQDVLILASISTAGKILAFDMAKSGYATWDTGQFFDLAFKEIEKIAN